MNAINTNPTILTKASAQWASRPSDERFVSLIEMHKHAWESRLNSHGMCISSRKLAVAPMEDSKELYVIPRDGYAAPAKLTHWSFGQMSQRAKAPAGYLRKLPAEMAADCLNYGIQHINNIEDIGVLIGRDGNEVDLRAATGPNYGRIWNSDVIDGLISRFGDGINGDFTVPGEFGVGVEVNKDNTTLFASDRDMFVFLADEKNRIEVPNRRDGEAGSLARGFFVWNSEVGSSTLGVATFLFDYVCSNRIVWGADQYQEIRIRHTAGAPDRFIEEITPALQSYANSSTASITKAITNAQQARIDDVDDFLAKRFTKTQAMAISAAHMADEGRPIETLWDAATGVTAYARGINYQDDRVAIERIGGKILDLAS